MSDLNQQGPSSPEEYEIARLQSQLAAQGEAVKVAREALDTCTPGDYSTGHVIAPSFDEQAVSDAIAKIDALGIGKGA